LLLFKDKVNCNKKIKRVMHKLNLNEFKKLNITFYLKFEKFRI